MTLLPPNSSPLERSLEAVTARNTALPIPISKLWDPMTCPEHVLPWLAWGFGLHDWKSYWPTSIKRAVIRDAIDLKRRQGTAASVRRIVTALGAQVALTECWQIVPKATPHTFSVVINATSMGGQAVTDEFQQDIIDAIIRAKPVRSHFTVTAGLIANGSIGISGEGRAYLYRRLELIS